MITLLQSCYPYNGRSRTQFGYGSYLFKRSKSFRRVLSIVWFSAILGSSIINPACSQSITSGCYALRLASSGSLLTNVNGKLKVQPNNSSDNQVFRLDGAPARIRLVAQGGSNRGYISYPTSIDVGGEVTLKSEFSPATHTNSESSAPIWIATPIAGGSYGFITPPFGNPQLAFGSTIAWGNGSSDPNVSDIYLVTQSDMNVYGSCKWYLDSRSCPADFCDFNISASSSNYNPTAGTPFIIAANCVGGGCAGVTYSWSPSDGLSSSGNTAYYVAGFSSGITGPTNFTVGARKDGCSVTRTSSTVVNMMPLSSTFSQCLEAESSSGNGAITSDPNASNGQTRGEENNNNHYVDYAVSGVPAGGTYYMKLRYYSSSPPVVKVQVNNGSDQTVNLAPSNSWNIAATEQTISVFLNPGNSTIRIQGIGGGSCRQDKICISSNSNARIGVQQVADVEKEGSAKLTLSPNPTSGDFFARFYLEQSEKANLRVIDMNGRTLYQRNVIGKGYHNEKVEISGNVSGNLLVQVLKDNGQEVKKVVIAR